MEKSCVLLSREHFHTGPILCLAGNHCRLWWTRLLWKCFWVGGWGGWLALWETRASNGTLEWLRWTQWHPLIKASERILLDWVCDVHWRGLKPKLTSPFDRTAPSCSDVSTCSLWNMLQSFVQKHQDQLRSLCWWSLLSWLTVTPLIKQTLGT